MLLTLLSIGAYTTYKFLDNEDKKMRLDNLMVKGCDMRKDEDFDEFLSIMKTDKQKIIGYDDCSMSDFLFHAEKNLNTIPYLSDDDIKRFRERCWRVKALHYIHEREIGYESACKRLVELKKECANKPTTRKVYKKRKTYLDRSELDKLKYTFFGSFVYQPEGGKFYSMTDLYYIFIVDQPQGVDMDVIFYNSLFHTRYSTPSAKEMEAVRRAGMYNEIYG